MTYIGECDTYVYVHTYILKYMEDIVYLHAIPI